MIRGLRAPIPLKTNGRINLAVLLIAGLVASVLQAGDPPSVRTRTVEDLLQRYCGKCHAGGNEQGSFRLDELSRDFSDLSASSHWGDVLQRITTGAMPPEDEPPLSGEQAALIVDWIGHQLTTGAAKRAALVEPVRFLRLTREEYANTVQDLLGVTVDVCDPGGLQGEEPWQGFERIGSMMSLSPSHVDRYYAMAEQILEEAYPEHLPSCHIRHLDALDLRSGPIREELEARGLLSKVRVDLWPGATILRDGVAGQRFPHSGRYRFRIQLSGLQPTGELAPHLKVNAGNLDRVLFEKDVVAPEKQPVIVEFESHLPAGVHSIHLSNTIPGVPASSRSGRRDPRIPFISLEDGRRPWQLKLTNDEGAPLVPFLIVDWMEWEGPLPNPNPLPFPEFSSPNAQPFPLRPFFEQFAERAFRRPVDAEEVRDLLELVEIRLKQGATHREAVKTALLAILSSAEFYYLIEGKVQPSSSRLNGWELASRLSYFLWSSLPDGTLVEAARSESLLDPQQLRAQARRMLTDSKAERFAVSFPTQWLQLQQLGMFPPDQKLYPDYSSHLQKSMLQETTTFFGEVFKQNLSLSEFLQSDWTMLNERLARHYGISDVIGDDFRRVALQSQHHRGGLLTQAAVLSLTSDGARHRPVHRGKWILESLYGRPPPPPPASIDPIEPTPLDQPKATIRMKLQAHVQSATCAACHRKIDPLGLAFDRYDAIGRWRTTEDVRDGMGEDPVVDASGQLPDGRSFADEQEFKRLLLADVDQFAEVFLEKLAVYALRRPMTIDDRPELRRIAGRCRQQGYRIQALIEEFVLSDLFQDR